MKSIGFAIPKDHPRAQSLKVRELLVEGFRRGLVAEEGLVAHGRGEAFDYLVGERTTDPARRAIKAAAAYLLSASHPVISANGNTVAMVPREIVQLSKEVPALIEVNLFYRTRERQEAIAKYLRDFGANEVLGVSGKATASIPELMSERRRVDPKGILKGDVILVPLEDGDRTEALVKLGKKVIAIDLNPLSRTAQSATVTIVDNIVRAIPLLIKKCRRLRTWDPAKVHAVIGAYDNKLILQQSLLLIQKHLSKI